MMKNNIKLQKPPKRFFIGNLIWEIILFLIICCSLIPVLWGFFLSLKTNQDILLNPFAWPEILHWENYTHAFSSVPYVQMIKNTFIVIVIALPVSIIVEVTGAFAISRMKIGRGRMQNGLYKYFIAGVILPGYVMLFPIYIMSVKLGIYNTLWALIFPAMAGGASMGVMLLSASFRAIPKELDEAAIVDGCGLLRLLVQILVPIVSPTIATLTILNFLSIWNNFVLARVLINDESLRVISQAVMYFKGEYSTDYALTMAGTMILILPQLCVFAFLQKYVVDGVTAGAIKA